MKIVEPIEAAEFEAFDENQNSLGIKKEIERFNSCRFCLSGRGSHRVTDDQTGEVFFICDEHLAVYNQETDSVPPPPEPVLVEMPQEGVA